MSECVPSQTATTVEQWRRGASGARPVIEAQRRPGVRYETPTGDPVGDQAVTNVLYGPHGERAEQVCARVSRSQAAVLARELGLSERPGGTWLVTPAVRAALEGRAALASVYPAHGRLEAA
jgi:hypothetical protein